MRESNHTRMGAETAADADPRSSTSAAFAASISPICTARIRSIPAALEECPRDRYMLISKIWWRPGGIPEAERPDADVVVHRFLKELKTDYLDLVLLALRRDSRLAESAREADGDARRAQEQGHHPRPRRFLPFPCPPSKRLSNSPGSTPFIPGSTRSRWFHGRPGRTGRAGPQEPPRQGQGCRRHENHRRGPPPERGGEEGQVDPPSLRPKGSSTWSLSASKRPRNSTILRRV